MTQLANGLRTSAEVVEVVENFDQIPNSNTKCHKTLFRLDDGSEYTGQVCSQDTRVPFETGDTIDIVIKSFTRGIYTFTVEKVTGFREIKLSQAGTQVPQTNFGYLNVAGTPGAIALQAAVHHNTHRVNITPEKILEDAAKFLDFLRTNTN